MQFYITASFLGVLLLAAIYMAGRLHGWKHGRNFGYSHGYDKGKVDGISEGWRRGWTQPRLSNGRFTRWPRANVETRGGTK